MERLLSAGGRQNQNEDRKTEDYGRKDKGYDRSRSEEWHFLRMYTLILNYIIETYDVSEEDIGKSIERISNSFICDEGTRFQFSAIDFKNPVNICAYLYRYGSHGAGFARNRISNALKNCGHLQRLRGASDLRVVCLGAGPGNDAIGLFSALAEWGCPSNLSVTLVDKFEEWCLCADLACNLAQKKNLGNVSELFRKSRVKLRYSQVDLPGDFCDDAMYFTYLEEADVIVIAKLLSILDLQQCQEIIEGLGSIMKQGAFVFLLDQYLDYLWKDFEVIYTWGTEERDIYRSFAEAEPRFSAYDSVTSKFPIRILRLKPNAESRVYSQVVN